MIDQQKFTELKAKYNIPQNHVKDSDSNFLYFILTKADVDIELLNELDWDWLKNNISSQAVKLLEQLKEQQFKGLVTEFNSIYDKYCFLFLETPNEVLALKPPINFYSKQQLRKRNTIFSILKKLDFFGKLHQSEIEYLKQNQLNISKLYQFLDFLKLKTKYHVTHYVSVSPSDQLYTILSQVDSEIPLTDKDIQLLNTHNLTTVLESYELQQRKREEEFVKLKEKYQATQFLETSPNSRLYIILRNIETNKFLTDDEIKWLNDNNLNETVILADFITLKVKYKATANEDLSASSHLYKVLKKIDADIILHEQDINFLKKRELTETITIALYRYGKYLINQIELRQQLNDVQIQWIAKNERHDIIQFALTKHFKELKQKYQVENCLENSHESPLYLILKKLDQNQRLDATEIAYLQDKNLFYGQIYTVYHTIEAQFYEADYQKTGNKWNLPNISSHWRKADQPKTALKSTDNIDLDKIKEGKLKSAILTTRGGAFRDVEQLDEAEKCARQAITFQPSSHHPYTLMGAICYDRYQRTEGDEWFRKAIERGASPDSIDSEIKKSLARMKDKNKRDQMARDLFKKDSRRYSWASKFLIKKLIKFDA